MIAKLRKEQKQMTSTNQSLAKQLEKTNAKYDKLQNEYDLVIKEDTQLINELECEIDELQKWITAQSQNAFLPLDLISNTSPAADDQKTEAIHERVTVGVHSAPHTQRLPSFTSFRASRNVFKPQKQTIELRGKDTGSNFTAYNAFSLCSSSIAGSIGVPRFLKLYDIPEILPKVLSESSFENEPADSKSFQYGEYLEYWRPGHTNSVQPKYKDLKEEMTSNNVARIASDKYDELHSKAQILLVNKPLIAKRIGNNNKMCGIEAGTAPSVEHIVALLIYTDFTYHQREFKKQCRKLSADEPLKELIRRNSEIYHWSKLMKELCIFYGEVMGENDLLYSGMGEYLMFDSLCTRFECPISTSTKLGVATRFANGAIILKFKSGSANTRTLDVTQYSCFGKDESECLVAGSTLQIVDILISNKSHRSYVSALRMFEQIMNGHFIDGNEETASKLISLLQDAVSPTLRDKLRNLNLESSFYTFLEDEGHDSDAVMEDIVEDTSSEINKCFGSGLFAQVQKYSTDYAGKMYGHHSS